MKRKRPNTAEEKLYGFYRDEGLRTVDRRLEAFRKLTNLFCDELEIEIVPTVKLCNVSRQNDCIRRKGGVPCGGGCYHSSPSPIIYMREMWGGYDTLLHELFHHINSCNDTSAIWKIMNAWHRKTFRKRTGYGDTLRKHGIPMKKRR